MFKMSTQNNSTKLQPIFNISALILWNASYHLVQLAVFDKQIFLHNPTWKKLFLLKLTILYLCVMSIYCSIFMNRCIVSEMARTKKLSEESNFQVTFDVAEFAWMHLICMQYFSKKFSTNILLAHNFTCTNYRLSVITSITLNSFSLLTTVFDLSCF